MRAVTLLMIGCVVSAAGFAVRAGSQDSRIDALFAEYDRDDSPGAAVVVVRDGAVIHRKGYGMANLEHGVPITPTTVFDIASVSKQFAGMAIAMLVERGEIDLGDDIRTYLPELPDFGPTVTIDHLVHHTSGIRDWPGTLAVGGWRMDDVISFDQILAMAEAQRDLNFTPGAEYSYSNTGYNILAHLVERVSGTSFREWTDANIFQPLGMRNTHFHDDHTAVHANRAQGYTRADGAWHNFYNGLTALGSSSLFTTVDDLTRWTLNFDTGDVGGRTVIERTQQRGVLNDGERIAYAFGQSEGSYRGVTTWSHTGSWAGFRTVLVRVPAHRTGVIILTNIGDYNPSRTAYQILDIVLADRLGPAAAPASNGSEDTADTLYPTLSARDRAAYVGEYYSPELQTVYDVLDTDGTLVARHARHGTIALSPIAADTFRGDQWFFLDVVFERDDEDRVTAFRVSNGRSRNIRFVKR